MALHCFSRFRRDLLLEQSHVTRTRGPLGLGEQSPEAASRVVLIAGAAFFTRRSRAAPSGSEREREERRRAVCCHIGSAFHGMSGRV